MTSSEKNTATLLHLSALSQVIIPLGNYIFPAIIWSSKKDTSEFVDFHGKQALNFQLSTLLYSMILLLISIPIMLFTIFNGVEINNWCNEELICNQISNSNLTGIVFFGIICFLGFLFLKMMELFLIFYVAVKASNGEKYKYPLTINFLK